MDEIKENMNKVEYLIEVVTNLKMMMYTEYSNLYSESCSKKFATDLITRGKLEAWHKEMYLLEEMIQMINSI